MIVFSRSCQAEPAGHGVRTQIHPVVPVGLCQNPFSGQKRGRKDVKLQPFSAGSGAGSCSLDLGSAVSAGCHGNASIPEFIVSPWFWITMMRPRPGLSSGRLSGPGNHPDHVTFPSRSAGEQLPVSAACSAQLFLLFLPLFSPRCSPSFHLFSGLSGADAPRPGGRFSLRNEGVPSPPATSGIIPDVAGKVLNPGAASSRLWRGDVRAEVRVQTRAGARTPPSSRCGC